MEKAAIKNQSSILLMDVDRKNLPDAFPDRVPISELRKIWNDKSRTYSDNELYRIREWLYNMANITLNIVAQNSEQNVESVLGSDEIGKRLSDIELFGNAA